MKNKQMKWNGSKKRILASALTACFVLAELPGVPAYAALESEQNAVVQDDFTKNENVYAKLGADGSVGDIYVVNAFEAKEKTKISDYGTYEEVRNLTDLSNLAFSNGNVTFEMEKGKFYYQGTLREKGLPWNIEIRYFLDGKSVKPEELGGATGALEIKIHTTQNQKVNAVFFENYVMQISLDLDGEKCAQIEAADGMIADAGGDKTISFTVLPGKEAGFSIKADVTEFTMSGMSIAAVPYSMNVDMDEFNTEDVTGQMEELTDAIARLNNGTAQLSSGIQALNSAGGDLKNGAGQIEKGLQELSNNSGTITNASAQIRDALGAISSQLQSADFSGMEQLGTLPETLKALSGSLGQMETGLEELYNGFTQSYTALESAIYAYQGESLTEEEITALQTVTAENMQAQAALGKLMETYQALLTIQGTYEAVKPAFDAVIQTLDKTSENSVTAGVVQVCTGLDQMSEALVGQLSKIDITASMNELKNGIATLAGNYASFHDGLSTYTGGVTSLSNGYTEFSNGLNSYLDGIDDLHSGSGELSDGMQQLTDGVREVPEQMQSTIDEMMEEYSSADFDAVSFTDTRNTKVDTVQFVLSTAEIVMPVVEESTAEPEEEMGFWERVKTIFK